MTEDITSLLRAVSSGDPSAWEKLTPLIYQELKNLARSAMQRERPEHTLQATGLVHELFLRLVKKEGISWEDRAHFYKVATMTLHWILIDYGRHRWRSGGPGRHVAVPLESRRELAEPQASSKKLEVLDIALKRLEGGAGMQRKCRILNMRFFLGMTFEEIATELTLAVSTVKNDWHYTRAWLLREMKKIETYGL